MPLNGHVREQPAHCVYDQGTELDMKVLKIQNEKNVYIFRCLFNLIKISLVTPLLRGGSRRGAVQFRLMFNTSSSSTQFPKHFEPSFVQIGQ